MKIVLDAGHYSGYNISSVFPLYREGDMTWKLYGYLQSELQARGFQVTGTRSDPKRDLPVYDRGQKAAGADLMISLHSNACDTETVRRVVVITPIDDRNGTEALGKKLGERVSSVMGISEPFQPYVRAYKGAGGKLLDYYGVLRGAVAAGCKRSMIIEHGFHTNAQTAYWLYHDTNLKRLAIAEAEVIADALGAPEASVAYSPGDLYTVKATDHYSDGRAVAGFCVGRTMTIKKVLPGKILLAEINSWVVTK